MSVTEYVASCLLLKDGQRSWIAQSQRIHEIIVRRHLDDWFNEEQLTPKNGGFDSHLDAAQTAELIAYLTNNLFPTT